MFDVGHGPGSDVFSGAQLAGLRHGLGFRGAPARGQVLLGEHRPELVPLDQHETPCVEQSRLEHDREVVAELPLAVPAGLILEVHDADRVPDAVVSRQPHVGVAVARLGLVRAGNLLEDVLEPGVRGDGT